MMPSIINVVGNANVEVLHGGQHANAKGSKTYKRTPALIETNGEAGCKQIELRNNNASKTTTATDNADEIPSTSKPRPKMTDSATSTQESDAIVEIRVGDKILKLDMNISKWLQSRKKEIVLKKRKSCDDATDTDSQPSQAKIDKISHDSEVGLPKRPGHRYMKSRLVTPASLSQKSEESKNIDKCIRRSISTMTPPIAPRFEHLSPADQSLKAFFDSMLRATQRLPLFHQRRIRGDLQKVIQKNSTKVDGIVNAMRTK